MVGAAQHLHSAYSESLIRLDKRVVNTIEHRRRRRERANPGLRIGDSPTHKLAEIGLSQQKWPRRMNCHKLERVPVKLVRKARATLP